MKAKSEILLGALMLGIEILKDNKTYVMSEDMYLCEKRIDEEGEVILLKLNFGQLGLHQFINWANEFTDDEVFLISANITLQSIK